VRCSSRTPCDLRARLAGNGQADDLHRVCHHFVWVFDVRDKVESHAILDVKEFPVDYVALMDPYTVASQVLFNHPTSATYFCYNGSGEHVESPENNLSAQLLAAVACRKSWCGSEK
jgi:hypothetical protein